MQISTNTTGMLSGLTVFTDKDGRDHCVVVVKGTFTVHQDSTVTLAEEQQPLVYADQHYGDPGSTSIQYECDFAPSKPRADVIVNGFAISKNENPVREMLVGLQVGQIKKIIKVFGDRYWDTGLAGLRPSDPKPFVNMPLKYENAFGGTDQTSDDPKKWGFELRNLVGVGFYTGNELGSVAGKPIPNLEDARQPISSWYDRPAPAAFGGLARGWQPRIKFAGTYDQLWLDQRFPFLPEDFDHQYFQSAPADQQFPYLKGGEAVRCVNMTPEGSFSFAVPQLEIPITYRFRDRNVTMEPKLDTLIVEPDQYRFIATWRVMVPLGRKIHNLREITVGHPPKSTAPARTANGKLHFSSINEAIAWKKHQDKPVDDA